jgi:hypothetical protein
LKKLKRAWVALALSFFSQIIIGWWDKKDLLILALKGVLTRVKEGE